MKGQTRHSLRFKLGLLLGGLFGIVGAAVLVAVLRGAGHYSDEVNHRLNREAAAHIVSTIEPFQPGTEGAVNKEALKGIFMDVMVVNPTLEVYLIDLEGELLAYDAPEDHILRRKIDVSFAIQFLDSSGEEPVLGDDPRSESDRKPISVERVEHEGQHAGYLYIILGGEAFDGVAGALQESYILRWGAGSILGAFLVAVLAGLGALGTLTRPLERLRSAMQSFREEGRAVPLEVGTRDEIGALTRDFNQMAERIAEQVELLRETDEDRRTFVANISHDLRTPTATVQGYLETLLIKAGDLDEQQREDYLRVALRQVERLGLMVDELFELARLEAKDVQPQMEVFPLAELASDVVAKFGTQDPRVRFELVVASGASLDVMGDLGLLERVFDNLLDNARRHSPDNGLVRIQIEAAGDRVAARVQDQGPGIPIEQRARVFERFFRGESIANHQGSTGLGLAIVHRVVELHGGEVKVEEASEGTSILMLLPRANTGA